MKLSFAQYDCENPSIWEAFERIANSLIARGKKHIGAKQVFEIIRYETSIVGGKDYKVNNTYTADYARKFVAKYPEHKDKFEFREVNRSKTITAVSQAARILSDYRVQKRYERLAGYPTLF